MILDAQGISPLDQTFIAPSNAFSTKVTGVIDAHCLRRDGREEHLSTSKNGVVNLGFNMLLDSGFRYTVATQYKHFYIGLIANSGWTGAGLQAADTIASHSSWTENHTGYTPATYTGAVNNGGGYGGGTTTMDIDGVSQAIPAGTPFTVAGISGTYVVTSTTGGGTPTAVTFTPGLSGTVADNVVLTFGNGRPIWTPSAASNKAITNPSSVNFPINTDSTVIKGIFVVTDPTLNGTLGLLWSTGLFASDQTLFSGDVLKITYTVSLS
jgi:hypothetical protein